MARSSSTWTTIALSPASARLQTRPSPRRGMRCRRFSAPAPGWRAAPRRAAARESLWRSSMPRPRALIGEDEPVLRVELAEMLVSLWPELDVVAKVADGVEALRALEEHRPDVMFLDIQMPGLGGIDVARQAGARCHIAFITAYDQYAVAAFEQGAVDYVLKPFSAGRLATTIARMKAKLASPPADLSLLLQQFSAAGR